MPPKFRERRGIGASYAFVREGFDMKKLIVLIAIIGIAAFAFSKLGGSKEEHEFGA